MNRTAVVRRHNVRWKGRGEHTIVLAHGFGCDQHVWHRLLPHLAEDYRILLFDYIGSGRSDASAYSAGKYHTLAAYAADLVELVRTFDLRNCTVVGHSVSAMITLEAAIAAPEAIGQLVMLAPSPRYIDDLETGYSGGFQPQQIDELIAMVSASSGQWSQRLAKVVVDDAHPEQQAEMERLFCATPALVASQFAQVTFRSDSRALLPQCPVPTLVVECTGDPIAPHQVGRYVARMLPRSAGVRLATGGHCPHLTAPDETGRAIADFLGALRHEGSACA